MILNLTQHLATTEQIKAGVFEPRNKAGIQEVLTFNSMPTAQEVICAAECLVAYAKSELFSYFLSLDSVANDVTVDEVKQLMAGAQIMIGGAPFLMASLEKALKAEGLCPVHAFSQRESVDVIMDNGNTSKTSVFRHLGFVIVE